MIYLFCKIGKGVSIMTEYKCPFCGNEIHPGDQVCLSCGKKIPNVTMNLSDFSSNHSTVSSSSKTKRILIFSICFTLVLILVVFLVVWFGILKG